MGRAAAEDPPGAGFARLAEALPTESEGLVHCIFTMNKGASIIYDTAPAFRLISSGLCSLFLHSFNDSFHISCKNQIAIAP
ncbi:hypothetical protein ACE4RR_13795 [Alteribacillus sp. HJP-4]